MTTPRAEPSRSRSKRVPPARTGPLRNPMAAGTPQSGPNPAKAGALAGANGVLQKALECGVQTAYAVIEDYMKRGYEAARKSRDNPNNRGRMGEEKSSYNNWSNPWGPISPLMEQWTVAMRTWSDAWTALMPGARPGGWPPAAWNPGFPPAHAPATAPSMTVEVSSRRPTEISASLKPGVELLGKFTADSFVPPLQKGVSLSHHGGHLRVSVAISDDQAAGRYSGVIRASDGCVIGDLTVVISEPRAEPA
jgi:hypothetical protein